MSTSFSIKRRSVSKGSDPINVSELRERLYRLKAIAQQPISTLEGQARDDLTSLVTYTRVLYDTDAYGTLHEQVKSIFGTPAILHPGTVEAFIAGCLVDTNLPQSKSCSAVCSGSIPLPRGSQGSEPCTHQTILAHKDEKGYNFVRLNDAADKENIIIYVPSGQIFPGLSPTEKAQLQGLGGKNVNIMTYSDDGRTYQELYNGFVPMDRIPTRSDGGSPAPTTTSGGPDTTLLIVLAIIFGLLILFILWRVWASSKGTSAERIY